VPDAATAAARALLGTKITSNNFSSTRYEGSSTAVVAVALTVPDAAAAAPLLLFGCADYFIFAGNNVTVRTSILGPAPQLLVGVDIGGINATLSSFSSEAPFVSVSDNLVSVAAGRVARGLCFGPLQLLGATA